MGGRLRPNDRSGKNGRKVANKIKRGTWRGCFHLTPFVVGRSSGVQLVHVSPIPSNSKIRVSVMTAEVPLCPRGRGRVLYFNSTNNGPNALNFSAARRKYGTFVTWFGTIARFVNPSRSSNVHVYARKLYLPPREKLESTTEMQQFNSSWTCHRTIERNWLWTHLNPNTDNCQRHSNRVSDEFFT